MTKNRTVWLFLIAGIVFPLLTVVAADSESARSLDPPPAEIQLFNGRNFDGLQIVVENSSAKPAKTWTVVDGMLRSTGTPKGYIRTTMAYADYKLHVEWRWPNGDGTGNSGVMLHIVNHDEVWPKGFEANLQSGRVGDINDFMDARFKDEILGRVPGKFATGRIERPAAESAEKPIGEWNAFDIVASGDTITLTVNGVQVNRVTGVIPSGGMIGLQSEGAAIDFRNVTLTPLLPAKDVHVPRLPRS